MSYFSSGAAPIHIATHAKLVFDVSGAGDAVMATFAYGLFGALPTERAMRLANPAAGIVVSIPGAATITLDELRVEPALREEFAAFRKGGPASADEAGAASICRIPARWRSCRERRALCDRLIVGLNGEKSVSRLKGPTRPVQRAAARAAIHGAIDRVDLVVVFGDDTLFDLIGALRPDLLIKGADHTQDQIVTADVVRSADRCVEPIKLVEGNRRPNSSGARTSCRPSVSVESPCHFSR